MIFTDKWNKQVPYSHPDYYTIIGLNPKNPGNHTDISFNNTGRSQKRNYSSYTFTLELLQPQFLTGFTDGEANFRIEISKNNERKTGWRVYSSFSIGLHNKDRVLLENVRASLGYVGNISKQGKDSIHLQVSSLNDITKIIDHFPW